MSTRAGGEEALTGRTNDGVRRRRSLWKAPALLAGLIVLVLLVASRTTDGWNWPPRAFVVVGLLLFSVGFIYELITRKRDTIAYRAAVGIAFTAAFLLTWGNLVQQSGGIRAAALYLAVPVVGIIGALLARLRPQGMARALFVTALAQAVVLAIVLSLLISENPEFATWTPPDWRGFGGNALFAGLFAGSALLFRKAGRGESVPGAV